MARGHTGALPAPSALRVAAVLGVAAVVAVVRAGAATGSPPRQCCGAGVLLHEKACADGTAVALNCSFKFLLDQDVEEDAWVLRKDGTLTLDNTTTHDYCLARVLGPGPHGEGGPSRLHDVALVCHDVDAEGQDDDPRPDWWFRMASVLSWLSVACLALTLAAHIALPELRDLQGRCHMGAVASLGLALLVLAVLQEATLDGTLCTTMAFLVYYWFLSAFFWLNVTSFNVWRSVVLEHRRYRERTLFACYLTVSCGAPMVLLLALLTAHLLPEGHEIVRPQFGRNKCWFYDDRATWAWFYWPLAVLVGMNVVYFVWTTARLWRQYAGGQSRCRRQALRRRFLLSLKLFLIMGISWIFELISSAANTPGSIVWYLTDTFNAMQGVVILLILVVWRRRFWRAVHKRRPCGLTPPEGWAYPPSAVRDECGDSTDTDDDEGVDRHYEQELKDMAGLGARANGGTKL